MIGNFKKNKNLLFVMLFVLLILIGGSYAWLTLTLNGTKNNVLRAGTLKMRLDDTISDGINLSDTVPMSDTKGLTTTAYTFSLINEGSTDSDYTIYLDDLALNVDEVRMKDEYVKYSLVKNDGDAKTALLTTTGESPNRVLETGTIDGNTTNNYTLRLWIDSDADNAVMGTIFYGQLRVEATQKQPSVLKGIDKTDNISAIILQDKIEEPANTVSEYDVSSKQNGDIMQYNVLNEDGTTYTAYVQSDGIITAPTDSSKLFAIRSLTNLTGMENLDTSNVTNMSSMFASNQLTTIDLSHLNTSNVTDMRWMFDDTMATSLDLSKFNTSKVTTMAYMFAQMDNLESIDLNSFNTSKVTDMSFMFYENPSLTSIDLSPLETENVTTMYSMFYEDVSLEELDFSSLNLENLETAAEIVDRCTGLRSINLDGIVADKLKSVEDSFFQIGMGNSGVLENVSANNMSLNSITYLGWGGGMQFNKNMKVFSMNHLTANSLTDIKYMFSQYTDVTMDLIDFSYLNAPNLTGMNRAFLNANVKNINLSNTTTPKLKDMNSAFYGIKNLENINFKNFDTSGGPYMGYLFANSQMSSANFLSDLDMSNVSDTYLMFNGAKGFTDIDISGWDLSNIESPGAMFGGSDIVNFDMHGMNLDNMSNCYGFFPSTVESVNMNGVTANNIKNDFGSFLNSASLKNLNLSNANMNGLSSFNGAFSKNTSPILESVNMENFSATGVTSISSMFASSPASTINLSGSKIGSSATPLKTMSQVFNGTSNVSAIDISSWDTSNVTDASLLFTSTGATLIDITGLNFDNITNVGGFFASTAKLDTLNMNNTSFTGIAGLGGMFSGTGATTVNMNNVNFSKVTSVSGTLGSYSLPNIETLNMENADFSSLVDATAMFNGMTKLSTLNIKGLKTGTLTNTQVMFANDSLLATIDLSSLDFSNVTTFGGMFGSLPSNVNVIVKDSANKSFVESRLSEVGITGGTVSVA